jgi:DNA-binding Xre family transcriptional regulator
MVISYNKLWKLLIDKKIRKADLRRAAGVAPNTMTRLRRDQEVSLPVLYKICMVLDADIGDIMEFLPEQETDSAN